MDPHKTDEPVSSNRSVYQKVTLYHIVRQTGSEMTAEADALGTRQLESYAHCQHYHYHYAIQH